MIILGILRSRLFVLRKNSGYLPSNEEKKITRLNGPTNGKHDTSMQVPKEPSKALPCRAIG
jgi:hypothetical protein